MSRQPGRSVAMVAALVFLAAGCGAGDGGKSGGRALSEPGSAPSSTAVSTTTVPPATTTTSAAPTTTTSVPPPPTVTEPGPTTTVGALPAVVVRTGDTSRRTVALTFDAGSDTGATGRILDMLAAAGVSASFGLTGRWVEENPGLVRRIVAEGHQVVNHTYGHPSFTGRSTGRPPLTAASRWDELVRGDAAIVAATGTSSRPWFRPPYGDVDDGVLRDVAAAGWRYVVMWSVDSLGWQGTPAADVVARCLDAASPGAIYLFHVGSASTDADALGPILDGLRVRGYGFATVAEILPPEG